MTRIDGSELFTQESNEQYTVKATSEENGIVHGVPIGRETLEDLEDEEVLPGVYMMPLTKLYLVSSPAPRIYLTPGGTLDAQITFAVPHEVEKSLYVDCYHYDMVNHKSKMIFNSNPHQVYDDNIEPTFVTALTDEEDSPGTKVITIEAVDVDPYQYTGLLTCFAGYVDFLLTTTMLLPECQSEYLSFSLLMHLTSHQFEITGDEISWKAGENFQMGCQALGSPAISADIYLNGELVTDNIYAVTSSHTGISTTYWVFENPPASTNTLTCQGYDGRSHASLNHTLTFVRSPDVFKFDLISWIEEEVIK